MNQPSADCSVGHVVMWNPMTFSFQSNFVSYIDDVLDIKGFLQEIVTDKNWKLMDISAAYLCVYFNTHSPGWITEVYLQPPHCSNDSNNGLNGVTVDNSFVLFTFIFWITSFMDNPMEQKKKKHSLFKLKKKQQQNPTLYHSIPPYLLHLFHDCAFPWFTSSWKIDVWKFISFINIWSHISFLNCKYLTNLKTFNS